MCRPFAFGRFLSRDGTAICGLHTFLLWRVSLPRGLFVFLPSYCCLVFFVSSLIADGANQRATTTLPIPRVVSRDLPISPRFTPTTFYRDCRFSTATPRQPMVELFVLASSRCPLRKSEENSLLLSLELTNSALVGVRCTH